MYCPGDLKRGTKTSSLYVSLLAQDSNELLNQRIIHTPNVKGPFLLRGNHLAPLARKDYSCPT